MVKKFISVYILFCSLIGLAVFAEDNEINYFQPATKKQKTQTLSIMQKLKKPVLFKFTKKHKEKKDVHAVQTEVVANTDNDIKNKEADNIQNIKDEQKTSIKTESDHTKDVLSNADSKDIIALDDESANKKKSKRSKKDDEEEDHVVVNNLYLDRFTIEMQADTNEFYKKRNMTLDKNGNVELILQSNGEKGIDTLIKEIEMTPANDSFTPPIEISLNDCIGIAIAKHPSVKSAKITTDISKAAMIQAWASYFPTFSVGASFDGSYSKVDGYGYSSKSMTIPSVSAGLLLFDFGKTKTEVDIAKQSYISSQFDLQDTINELIYSVKSAYFNLLFAQHQVDVYKKTIEDFDLQVKSARKFFSIGKKAEIDVNTAEYNAGNARLNLVKAVNTLENAKVELANTLGLPEFANFTLSDELPWHEYDLDLEFLLQEAFSIRPALLSAERELESAKLEVRRARRAFTPDITANGNGSYTNSDHIGSTSYGVGASLDYSINYLQLKKALDIAKLSYQRSKYNYEQQKQSVYLEVKQGAINLKNAMESVHQADINLKQAKAQNYQAVGRYNAGLSTAIELKDAENTYLNSQLEYYQSLLSYNESVANLERVVGAPMEVNANANNVVMNVVEKQDDTKKTKKFKKSKSKSTNNENVKKHKIFNIKNINTHFKFKKKNNDLTL